MTLIAVDSSGARVNVCLDSMCAERSTDLGAGVSLVVTGLNIPLRGIQ